MTDGNYISRAKQSYNIDETPKFQQSITDPLKHKTYPITKVLKSERPLDSKKFYLVMGNFPSHNNLFNALKGMVQYEHNVIAYQNFKPNADGSRSKSSSYIFHSDEKDLQEPIQCGLQRIAQIHKGMENGTNCEFCPDTSLFKNVSTYYQVLEDHTVIISDPDYDVPLDVYRRRMSNVALCGDQYEESPLCDGPVELIMHGFAVTGKKGFNDNYVLIFKGPDIELREIASKLKKKRDKCSIDMNMFIGDAAMALRPFYLEKGYDQRLSSLEVSEDEKFQSFSERCWATNEKEMTETSHVILKFKSMLKRSQEESLVSDNSYAWKPEKPKHQSRKIFEDERVTHDFKKQDLITDNDFTTYICSDRPHFRLFSTRPLGKNVYDAVLYQMFSKEGKLLKRYDVHEFTITEGDQRKHFIYPAEQHAELATYVRDVKIIEKFQKKYCCNVCHCPLNFRNEFNPVTEQRDTEQFFKAAEYLENKAFYFNSVKTNFNPSDDEKMLTQLFGNAPGSKANRSGDIRKDLKMSVFPLKKRQLNQRFDDSVMIVFDEKASLREIDDAFNHAIRTFNRGLRIDMWEFNYGLEKLYDLQRYRLKELQKDIMFLHKNPKKPRAIQFDDISARAHIKVGKAVLQAALANAIKYPTSATLEQDDDHGVEYEDDSEQREKILDLNSPITFSTYKQAKLIKDHDEPSEAELEAHAAFMKDYFVKYERNEAITIRKRLLLGQLEASTHKVPDFSKGYPDIVSPPDKIPDPVTNTDSIPESPLVFAPSPEARPQSGPAPKTAELEEARARVVKFVSPDARSPAPRLSYNPDTNDNSATRLGNSPASTIDDAHLDSPTFLCTTSPLMDGYLSEPEFDSSDDETLYYNPRNDHPDTI